MVSALISRLVILVFGTLYPAYASYKAIKTRSNKEYLKWMMYWIVMAFFSCIETVADLFVAWLPFYYELKILFVLWLLSPATKGSTILYRKIVHPQLAKREPEIDSYIQRASDQGYSAILNLGSKGFSYVTNVALTTAIKGQTKIADHLRKSYSMNDLSQDNQVPFRDDDEMSYDDEADNRMIEESYQREMMEKDVSGEKARNPRLKKRSHSMHEQAIHEVDEADEDVLIQSSSKKKTAYTHKEPEENDTKTKKQAYHYGTLPRSRGRTRAALKKT